MKLNPDCIRDILLELEKLDLNESITIPELSNKLTEYAKDEVIYNCLKLREANFIIAPTKQYVTGSMIVSIMDITYEGHQFLSNIRSNNIWNKTKNVMSKIGVTSISSISQIAAGVLTIIIKNELGLI